jgi:hypothetical protein
MMVPSPSLMWVKGRLQSRLLSTSTGVRSSFDSGHSLRRRRHAPYVPEDEIASAIAAARGALLIGLRLRKASITARAVPSITMCHQPSVLRSSSMSYDASGRSWRSPALTLPEIMRNAVSEAIRVPGRASRHCRSVHVSHSCFAGLQRRSRSGSQLPGEMQVLPFCSSHWSHK